MLDGTIAVLATDAGLDRGAIGTALALTAASRAHLDIHCLVIEQSPPETYAAGSVVPLVWPEDEAIDLRLTELEIELRAQIPRHRHDVQLHRLSLRDDQIGRILAPTLRFADWIVAAAPYGPQDRPAQVAVLELALLRERTPVIVAPDAGADLGLAPGRVAVAWDGSHEAMAAVRAAMPLLRRADLVDVVLVDPGVRHGDRADPGGDLALFLARNGVQAEVSVLSRSRPRISEVLRRHAFDTGAEALVMGAYGHSRLREAIFGGTTREMLDAPGLPLILAR